MPATSSDFKSVVVLGSFVADVSFRVVRLPAWGETLMGSAVALGPGGKGSNQAVAAARAGARARMVTKLGDDAFGQMARALWDEAGVDASLVGLSKEPTGSAAILLDEHSGENAIVVVAGACFTLTPEEVERVAGPAIRASGVLLTQLELPVGTVEGGLRLARDAGVTTVLNPAPAPDLAASALLLELADYLIPNESEARALSGVSADTPEGAAVAAAVLQARGARHVIVTLGAGGALVCPMQGQPTLVPAYSAGRCVETTGAGDAFCGAFAARLAMGVGPVEAAHFACAAAGISVTREGTARSMPQLEEIETLLAGG